MKNAKNLLLSAFVFVFAAAPFSRTANYGLINLDDYQYTLPYESEAINRFSPTWAFSHVDDGIWMPLTWFDYRLDYLLGGEDGRSAECHRTYRVMHVHSVLWHALGAVALFWLLLSLQRAWRRGVDPSCVAAALGALLWAVHPLRCESVCWIASRKDVISVFFLLLALVAWLRFRLACAAGQIPRAVCRYCLSLAMCAVGAMAKPSVMAYPALVFILDWFFVGIRPRRQDRASLLLYAPPLVLGLIVAVEGAWAQQIGGAMAVTDGLPLWWKLVNAATSCGLYLVHLVVPFGLAPQRELLYPDLPAHLAMAVPVAALLAAVIWRPLFGIWSALVRNEPQKSPSADSLRSAFEGACLWYAVAIFPMLGVVGFGLHSSSDRFTIIPMLGFSMFAACVLAKLLARCDGAGKSAVPFALVLVVLFWAASVRQSTFWRSDEVLFSHLLDVDGPRNAGSHLVLGTTIYEFRRDVASAAEHIRNFLAVSRNGHMNLGFVGVDILCAAGDSAAAQKMLVQLRNFVDECAQRLEKDPDLPQGHEHLCQASNVYRMAKLCYEVYDVSSRKDAEAKIDDELFTKPNSRPYVYMKGLCRKFAGDAEGAERARRLLLSGDCVGGLVTVRYRFLENMPL